jgi:hypothetical protein
MAQGEEPTISVFLPPVQFIVARQRDTFFEVAFRISRPPNGVSLEL